MNRYTNTPVRFREGSQSSSAPQGDRVRISRPILSGQALGPVTRVAQPWKTLPCDYRKSFPVRRHQGRNPSRQQEGW